MENRKKADISKYEDLYVNLDNVKEKRSNILLSIKNSLYLQEEYEKVIAIRKKKGFISKEIKKSLDSLNQDYQELKKMLPNVKGVISYTEKELVELDEQINSMKEETVINQQELLSGEDLKQQLIKEFNLEKKQKENMNNPSITPASPANLDKEVTKMKGIENKKKEVEKKLSKLDRIKNNLKVIESKIKDI